MNLLNRIRGVEDEPLRDYQIYTLTAVRKQSRRLRWASTKRLCELYREWSDDNYAAGWISLNHDCLGGFIVWAESQ